MPDDETAPGGEPETERGPASAPDDEGGPAATPDEPTPSEAEAGATQEQQTGEGAQAEQPAAGEEHRLSPADLDAVLRAAGVDASKAEYVSEDFQLEDVTPTTPTGAAGTIDLLKDVTLNVRIELGRTRMFLEDVLRLGPGSAVALDKLAGEAVDILVNGQLVARGEVIVLDENFCVRITEIVSPPEGRQEPTPDAQ